MKSRYCGEGERREVKGLNDLREAEVGNLLLIHLGGRREYGLLLHNIQADVFAVEDSPSVLCQCDPFDAVIPGLIAMSWKSALPGDHCYLQILRRPD